MQIYLNGVLTHTQCTNLQELIQSLSLEQKRFAVEVNEQIISKSQLANTTLTAYDKIEIIHAVGGG